MSNECLSKIIVALDFPDESSALALLEQLEPTQCRLKVGKELFTRSGPALVKKIVDLGFDVFLDLKYHDIPNTVANACKAAADLGVWMVNVHAQGGHRMLAAARDALQDRTEKPLLIAVTVLTSMDEKDLLSIGITQSPQQYAKTLAALAQNEGLDGIVCSAQEISIMRQQFGESFLLVTPGIRPAQYIGHKQDDQRRIMTPVQAMKEGSDYLVIGRPITQADNPVSELLTVNSEISSLLNL